ncbi:hypothetical protein DPMN_086938 [Dreissena polymorpha]|uniref:Uncharacterized protein n=1 Tax=Dreissena polymorpha TaxID=45954 RepID=A0A9D4QVM7_DREPO|nr:hypothetical protein DPMN_086938 [Dreissena polymorpha]
MSIKAYVKQVKQCMLMIQYFVFLLFREGPATTGAAPGTTGTATENRDGTVAPPGPIQTPAELWQRPGESR